MLFSSSNWTNRTRWQVYTTKYSWKKVIYCNWLISKRFYLATFELSYLCWLAILSCQDAISNEGHLRPLEWTALFVQQQCTSALPCPMAFPLERRRIFLPPPPLPTTQQCSPASIVLAAATSAHFRAVLVSLSSSIATVHSAGPRRRL